MQSSSITLSRIHSGAAAADDALVAHPASAVAIKTLKELEPVFEESFSLLHPKIEAILLTFPHNSPDSPQLIAFKNLIPIIRIFAKAMFALGYSYTINDSIISFSPHGLFEPKILLNQKDLKFNSVDQEVFGLCDRLTGSMYIAVNEATNDIFFEFFDKTLVSIDGRSSKESLKLAEQSLYGLDSLKYLDNFEILKNPELKLSQILANQHEKAIRHAQILKSWLENSIPKDHKLYPELISFTDDQVYYPMAAGIIFKVISDTFPDLQLAINKKNPKEIVLPLGSFSVSLEDCANDFKAFNLDPYCSNFKISFQGPNSIKEAKEKSLPLNAFTLNCPSNTEIEINMNYPILIQMDTKKMKFNGFQLKLIEKDRVKAFEFKPKIEVEVDSSGFLSFFATIAAKAYTKFMDIKIEIPFFKLYKPKTEDQSNFSIEKLFHYIFDSLKNFDRNQLVSFFGLSSLAMKGSCSLPFIINHLLHSLKSNLRFQYEDPITRGACDERLFKLEDYTPHEPIPGPLLHPLTYQKLALIKEALKRVDFLSAPVSQGGRTKLEALDQAMKLLTEATPIFAIIELESKKEPLSHLESLTLKFLKEFATTPFETLKHKINFIIQSILQKESSPEDLMYADSQSFFLQ